MKKLVILLLISLTACAHWEDNYRPALSVKPKNAVKYESDTNRCIAETLTKMKAKNDDYNRRAWSGDLTLSEKMSGLTPPVIILANESLTNESFREPFALTDECMKSRGYKIVR